MNEKKTFWMSSVALWSQWGATLVIWWQYSGHNTTWPGVSMGRWTSVITIIKPCMLPSYIGWEWSDELVLITGELTAKQDSNWPEQLNRKFESTGFIAIVIEFIFHLFFHILIQNLPRTDLLLNENCMKKNHLFILPSYPVEF